MLTRQMVVPDDMVYQHEPSSNDDYGEKITMQLPRWASNILIANFLAIIGASCAAAWWARGVTSDITNLQMRSALIEAAIERAADDRYRARDAERDFRIRDEFNSRLHAQVMELERKVNGAK